MKPHDLKTLLATSTVAVGLTALSACSNMTAQERNTAAGAAIGAAAGSVLSNGSGVGTVGGAAVGGVIGNQIGTKRKD
ncbi:MAG: glycine zipper 2TM domain-containing protein [Aquabacterium sp.]